MTQGAAARRIGVIGDVHLRLEELERTLDGPLAACDELVCVGDVFDRGTSDPADVLALLDARDVRLLTGNHELAYLGGPVFAGMREPAGTALADVLRSRVLDGRLHGAYALDATTICVHGGISERFWRRHLRATCDADATGIAAQLDRWLVTAVAQRDFRHPAFAAIGSAEPGPYWARCDELVHEGLAPLDQLVGHVRMPSSSWLADAGRGVGRIRTVDDELQASRGYVGHVVVEVARR